MIYKCYILKRSVITKEIFVRQHSYLLCIWTLQRSDSWHRLLYGTYFWLTDCFFQHQMRYIPAVFIATKRLQNWHLVGTKDGTGLACEKEILWKTKFKPWLMVNNSVHHLNDQPLVTSNNKVNMTTAPQHMGLEIQVLAYDRHKNMAGLNWLMRYQPPPPPILQQ